MALFNTLTGEDLPLSYRFPRWSSELYYPCASIVIFDIDTRDSEVEYHIFVAEKDVNPLQIDPHASVIMDDGNWRDLTGKAITTITSVDSDSATETTVTLTINFDDLTSEEVSFTIPLSQGGGGADSESVAIIIASDGTLSFGSNFADSDTAKEAIRDFLCVDYDQVKFEAGFSGTTPGFYANEFVDSEGVGHRVLSATLAGNRLFLGTEPLVTPLLPYNPFFTANFIQRDQSTPYTGSSPITIDWDQPIGGIRYNLVNPSDRDGTAFITPRAISGAANTNLDPDILINYTANPLTHSNSGSVSVIYETDLNADQTASIFPDIAVADQFDNTLAGRGSIDVTLEATESVSVIDPNVDNSDITDTVINREFATTVRLQANWNFPQLQKPRITTGDLVNQNNFFEAYTTVPFDIIHVGIGEVANAAHIPTGINTTVTIDTDNMGGVLNFTGVNAIHKDNITTMSRGVRLDTVFTRPAEVIGREVIINDFDSEFIPVSGVNAPAFTYPSFFATPDAADSASDPRSTADSFDPLEGDFVESLIAGSRFRTSTTPGDIYDGRVNLLNSEQTDVQIFSTQTTFGSSNVDRHILLFGFRSGIANEPNVVTVDTGFGAPQPVALPTLIGGSNALNSFTRYTVPMGTASRTAFGTSYSLVEYTIFAYNLGGIFNGIRFHHQ